MDADAVLAGLDPQQRAAAQAVRGPVCVLAGAGTGKTRAITHRIAYAVLTGVVAAPHVLAVTFTTRAAGELRARLRGLGAPGVQARTFHAAALRQLTFFWPQVVGGAPPKVVESKLPLLVDAARALRRGLDRVELRDVAAEIEWAKVTQVRPEEYVIAAEKASRTPPLATPEVARLYEAYEEVRRERNLVDFESMLELTAAILTDHPEVAAQVRGQYRYFVVDEYQDVNPLQKLLLDTWLGGRDDICVVGDPSQTIYSFTGATPQYLLRFVDEFPEATVVRLVRDYRSTPQVVWLANTVLAHAAESARRHRLELVAQRPDGPKPVLMCYDDEVAEAAAVAQMARGLLNSGVPAHQIAVLFRANAQSVPYEHAFAEAGVPYVLRGAERFFERPEVRQAIMLLRGAARSPATDQSLPIAVRHVLAGLGLTGTPPAGGATRERWDSLAALAQLADDMMAAEPDADLPVFVDELARRAAEQHVPALAGVTLASLHAAKGLEWDAVFLVGLVDGMVPISYATTPEQIEEERRLLYVGITRAREHLCLSWALSRSPGGRRRKPSRFLDRVRPRLESENAQAGSRARKRAAPVPCRACGAALATAAERRLGRCTSCPPDYDEALFERLKSWRLATAQEQNVPAFVVFSDATLRAIAERSPACDEDLLAVPGVGRVKLERYGAAVLAVCGGEVGDGGGAEGASGPA